MHGISTYVQLPLKSTKSWYINVPGILYHPMDFDSWRNSQQKLTRKQLLQYFPLYGLFNRDPCNGGLL